MTIPFVVYPRLGNLNTSTDNVAPLDDNTLYSHTGKIVHGVLPIGILRKDQWSKAI